MSDQTKFIAYIDMHKQKGDKLRLGIEKGKQRVAELGASIGIQGDVHADSQKCSSSSSGQTSFARKKRSRPRTSRPTKYSV